MKQHQVSKTTNTDSAEEARKAKFNSITNAFIIGFAVGIVIYSVLAHTIGLVSLIPLFIIYKLVNKSKDKKQ